MATKKTNTTESEEVVLSDKYETRDFLLYGDGDASNLTAYSITVDEVKAKKALYNYINGEFVLSNAGDSATVYLGADMDNDEELDEMVYAAHRFKEAACDFAERIKTAVEAARLAKKLAKKE
jgi:hypothetical protein